MEPKRNTFIPTSLPAKAADAAASTLAEGRVATGAARVPVILEYYPADTFSVDGFRSLPAVVCDGDTCGLVVETAGRLDKEQPVLIRARDRSTLPFKFEDRTHAEVLWSRRIRPARGLPVYHCALQFYEPDETEEVLDN